MSNNATVANLTKHVFVTDNGPEFKNAFTAYCKRTEALDLKSLG